MPTLNRWSVLALCVASGSWIAGLSSAAQAAGDGYGYVSVAGENRIAGYRMDGATGKLTKVGDTSVEGAPGLLAVHPHKPIVYAALRSVKKIAALSYDAATGRLSPLAAADAVDNPVYVAVDPSGRWLLSAYYSANKAAVHAVDEDGRPQAKPLAVLPTRTHPHSILAAPSGRHVFVPNTGSDVVLQYDFDYQTGKLSPNEVPACPFAEKSGPRHFVFHPKLDMVYFVNEIDSTVTACALDAGTGRIRTVQTLSTLPEDFQGNNTCADIEITPDGRYLYASNRGHDSLAGYKICAQSGKLAVALGQTPTEKTPREFGIDFGGRFVFSAGQASGRLASYAIDANSGRLKPLEIYEVGRDLTWVLILPAK